MAVLTLLTVQPFGKLNKFQRCRIWTTRTHGGRNKTLIVNVSEIPNLLHAYQQSLCGWVESKAILEYRRSLTSCLYFDSVREQQDISGEHKQICKDQKILLHSGHVFQCYFWINEV
jgi:hypothetical protein